MSTDYEKGYAVGYHDRSQDCGASHYVEADLRHAADSVAAEIRDACREWAVQRFDEHGPHDAGGAALWGVAAWIDEKGPLRKVAPNAVGEGEPGSFLLPLAIRQAIQADFERPSAVEHLLDETQPESGVTTWEIR